MPEPSLADKLLALNGFSSRLKQLTVRSVLTQFSSLESDDIFKIATPDWNYMLLCASILANSDRGKCQDAALRIAQHCLTSKDSNDQQKLGAGVILDILTNSPATQLAIERGLLDQDFQHSVPLPLQLDMFKRGMQNSIIDPSDESLLRLNRFQTTVYHATAEFDWVSISAPTSSGKSFILQRIVEEFFRNTSHGIAIYIVPTRALVQEVELDTTERLSARGLGEVRISSVPRLPEDWQKKSNLFIFTQERLHWLLNEAPSAFKPHLIIIDEAQKIGDGARGILLQQVLEETARRSPGARMIFSSPMIRNPELLLKHATKEKRKAPVLSEQVAVNQNLLRASQVKGDPTRWNLELCLGQETIRLGVFSLPDRPTHDSKRLPFVAFSLGAGNGGNLVYVNGPAAAEKTALQLWELLARTPIKPDKEIRALISLIKKTVHKDYVLSTTLERGVACHYGNMPLLIRGEIERLFKQGKIQFLVCTSTLIEGVNLPARNIFMRGPQKGRGTPMGEIDFWNLAGRAGRQGKEFEGNVVCVDPLDRNTWHEPPPQERTEYTIHRALDEVAYAQTDDFLRYVSSGTPKETSSQNPELEHAFTYFFSEHIRHGTLKRSPSTTTYDEKFVSQIDALIEPLHKKVQIPEKILHQNPGVSPLSQQSLLDYFHCFRGNPQELIPAMPEDPDAVKSYMSIIERIGQHLTDESPKLIYYRAILVVNWMRGYSLARIISDNWKYWRKKGGKELNQVIRDTMKDIEEYARFYFAKYSSCYIDLLRYFFREKGLSHLVNQIPQISIWLEFGASQSTQLSLMEIGLSRTTAISLSELISDTTKTRDQALEWLKDIENLNSLRLSRIIIEEIKRVLRPLSKQIE
ncbi:DEAD/DEAH box helicase [Archangium sp. Cb G35]|uniref:DEAD/DEAH box helicase n=1 Tax=Archangium sp. Cb G35 TaxID=1920190 RepID=UPI000936D0B9|nr:DEAD/DEAH box helicase [Archangium sp. Cb G35]